MLAIANVARIARGYTTIVSITIETTQIEVCRVLFVMLAWRGGAGKSPKAVSKRHSAQPRVPGFSRGVPMVVLGNKEGNAEGIAKQVA